MHVQDLPKEEQVKEGNRNGRKFSRLLIFHQTIQGKKFKRIQNRTKRTSVHMSEVSHNMFRTFRKHEQGLKIWHFQDNSNLYYSQCTKLIFPFALSFVTSKRSRSSPEQIFGWTDSATESKRMCGLLGNLIDWTLSVCERGRGSGILIRYYTGKGSYKYLGLMSCFTFFFFLASIKICIIWYSTTTITS